jgi:hypothetical protein
VRLAAEPEAARLRTAEHVTEPVGTH